MTGFRILLCLAVLAACSAATEQDTAPAARDAATANTAQDTLTEHAARTGEVQEWQLVWSDEFDGDSIDSNNWTYDVDCWGGGNDEQQCYTDAPENAFVSEGELHIVAREEAATGPAFPPRILATLPEAERDIQAEQPFTSARLTTRGLADWKYGRFEIRAALPEGQGTWPAIWMLPTDDVYGPWAASGEIDIMEAVNLGVACDYCPSGIKNEILGTIHFGGVHPDNLYIGEPAELVPSDDGFHVFAIEWRAGEIKWFVDETLYSTLTSADWGPDNLTLGLPEHAPFDQPFHFILNVAIGGHLAVDQNLRGVSREGFPKTMRVDWVRVYAPITDISEE